MKTVVFTGGSSLLAQSWIKQNYPECYFILALHQRKLEHSKYKTIYLNYDSVDLIAKELHAVKADIVIKSLGFDPENLPELFSTKELSVSRWGTIKIDLDTMQTNIEGIFAAGDIVRGASLVVWAIKDGRDAAVQIQKYLREKNIQNIANDSITGDVVALIADLNNDKKNDLSFFTIPEPTRLGIISYPVFSLKKKHHYTSRTPRYYA